jgi:hypothetical protein
MSQGLPLLDPAMWPESPDEGFHAMRVLPGTGPRNEVLRVVGGAYDERVYRPVSKEFREAIACLNQLEPNERAGVGYGANTAAIGAISALQRLATALQAEGEDTGIELPPLNAYLANPPKLRDDLRHVTAEFLRHHLADDLAKLCTFSLILFRDTDFGGAIAKSLMEQRPQWRDALTPADKAGNDLHLAVIPPPSASIGISALAKELHCLQLLPCVIFLGSKPDRSLSGDSLLSRWSARRLQEPPPSFPEQLHVIYRTVYSSPVGGGGLWMATGDKYVQLVHEKVNLKVALTLIIGAIGGPACVQAFNTLSSLFVK